MMFGVSWAAAVFDRLKILPRALNVCQQLRLRQQIKGESVSRRLGAQASCLQTRRRRAVLSARTCRELSFRASRSFADKMSALPAKGYGSSMEAAGTAKILVSTRCRPAHGVD